MERKRRPTDVVFCAAHSHLMAHPGTHVTLHTIYYTETK